jgi:hypothetical protein
VVVVDRGVLNMGVDIPALASATEIAVEDGSWNVRE